MQFYNPSPFSVIADEWADQIVRTLPLLLIPMALPTNMDLLFTQFAVFFYAYGVYLHWGYESEYISAHNPVVNGAYEHYYHHAFSAGGSPIFTGFFFKAWDQLAGTVPKGACVCSRCEVARGARSAAEWRKVKLVDYSPLLTSAFWWSGEAAAAAVAAEKAAPAAPSAAAGKAAAGGRSSSAARATARAGGRK